MYRARATWLENDWVLLDETPLNFPNCWGAVSVRGDAERL